MKQILLVAVAGLGTLELLIVAGIAMLIAFAFQLPKLVPVFGSIVDLLKDWFASNQNKYPCPRCRALVRASDSNCKSCGQPLK